MNVLISLKSRVISDALVELLSKDKGRDQFFIDYRGTEVLSSKPDIIIVDHQSVSNEFLSSWPDAKVILLDTGLNQEEIITLILTYRLNGVISTDDDATLMRKALYLVNDGQIWINNSNLKALLSKAGTLTRNGRLDNISKKEHEILELISQGKKNKEIAAQLFMSEQTVKAHVSHIFKKFNVSSRTQLISHLMKFVERPWIFVGINFVLLTAHPF